MEKPVAVATERFGTGFTGLMYGHMQKHVGPGQRVIECEIVLRDDPEYVRHHLLRLLEGAERPRALIGICVQPDAETVAIFHAAGVPVVLVDEEQEGASTVSSDNFAGGYVAGRFLAEAGRRRCAMVSGPLHANGGYNALQRMRGFQKALAERGIPFGEKDVVEAPDYSRQDGVNALAAIVRARPDVEAVFCAAGDICATGLLATARELKLPVPTRLAVVGYDDHKLASVSNPPLSTVRQPLGEIAGEAWRLATRATAEILAKPQRLLLAPAMVRRATA
ncbi:MAG TPA: substrate-binding domain-containing protein [Anaeromyxobacter sp.]|nr:substrate-binding domain-containing protein [Anaeromyxobacter sp.]